MLPEVTLRDVTRDDVDRVAWWLEDRKLSSKWFGHYSCGDPVHRGYDPQHMLESSDWEWERIFGDPHRLIYSIENEAGEHIGECQVVLDGEGGAELALLIGRNDLRHRGYGTATALLLLDKIFGELAQTRSWVNVPEDNAPAMGLFEKLGFIREKTHELCTSPDGSAIFVSILGIDDQAYLARQPRKGRERLRMPVVTLTGLSGSGCESIGAEVARMTESRFIDDEITEGVRERLKCTSGELSAFEASHCAFWSRFMSNIAVPADWSAAYDGGYQWYAPNPVLGYGDEVEAPITKKHYLGALSGVLKRLAVEGDTVLHSHGSHKLVPRTAGAINVFVSASKEFRRQQLAATKEISLEEADKRLRQADKETIALYRHLYEADLLNMGQYDLVLNMDRLSFTSAAQIIVGALEAAAPGDKTRVSTSTTPAVLTS